MSDLQNVDAYLRLGDAKQECDRLEAELEAAKQERLDAILHAKGLGLTHDNVRAALGISTSRLVQLLRQARSRPETSQPAGSSVALGVVSDGLPSAPLAETQTPPPVDDGMPGSSGEAGPVADASQTPPVEV